MFRLVNRRITTTSSCFRRFYSEGNLSGTAGATASARGSFSDKEKAVENQWARSHDAEKIKALREALENQQKVNASLKKDLDDLRKSLK